MPLGGRITIADVSDRATISANLGPGSSDQWHDTVEHVRPPRPVA
jgi:hypothetical protein